MFFACNAAFGQDAQDRLTIHKVDSLLHSSKKYRKALERISAIPAALRVDRVVYTDSSDGKGNYFTDANGKDIPRDIRCCQIGQADKKDDLRHVHMLYYIYYSVNRNSIQHFSAKTAYWKHSHL